MESLSEVYEALHHKFPDTTDLDPYGREVVINGNCPLRLYEDMDYIYVCTSLDDQTFTQQMPDYDSAYSFAYGVLSKRVRIRLGKKYTDNRLRQIPTEKIRHEK